MLNIEELVADATKTIGKAKSITALDSLRIKYLGRKGYLTSLMTTIGNLPKKQRPKAGVQIHAAKNQVATLLKVQKELIDKAALSYRLATENIDISLPGRHFNRGSLHPVTSTINRIKEYFTALGFSVISGIEIEDSYHNFDALNIPSSHPARNGQDTFWFDDNRLLRTQTSSVQVRVMQDQKPPIRILAPGRVYRNDGYDRTHIPMFHQVEGLVIDEKINFAHLKSVLIQFLQFFFGDNPLTRFRSSYFPFTKPSAEVDILSQNNKWLEVLGCGMVHPKVLHNVGIDSKLYSGFAFGMGVERLTMLRHGIHDLRVFVENDLRFLRQFR